MLSTTRGVIHGKPFISLVNFMQRRTKETGRNVFSVEEVKTGFNNVFSGNHDFDKMFAEASENEYISVQDETTTFIKPVFNYERPLYAPSIDWFAINNNLSVEEVMELEKKALALTGLFTNKNYIAASNDLYDRIKQYRKHALVVLRKAYGTHKNECYHDRPKGSITEVFYPYDSGAEWLSEMHDISKSRIVQHEHFKATAYNSDETRSFSIDIRYLVMSQGQFSKVVRHIAARDKHHKKMSDLFSIESELNKAEARIAYLRKIQREGWSKLLRESPSVRIFVNLKT